METEPYPDDRLIQVFNLSGFSLPISEEALEHYISEIEKREGVTFFMLELVYVDENEMIRINKEYLSKDYLTDIITFRYDEDSESKKIEGTLYCCASRIIEQAKEYDATPKEEFYRIFIHGLLHLAGYQDQTEAEKLTMTELENFYLSTLSNY